MDVIEIVSTLRRAVNELDSAAYLIQDYPSARTRDVSAMCADTGNALMELLEEVEQSPQYRKHHNHNVRKVLQDD